MPPDGVTQVHIRIFCTLYSILGVCCGTILILSLIFDEFRTKKQQDGASNVTTRTLKRGVPMEARRNVLEFSPFLWDGRRRFWDNGTTTTTVDAAQVT